METWDILDENGNLTGRRMNKEDINILQDGIYHLGADVWIINSENKILIQKRSSQKKFKPNVWAMTGGCVISGETTLETLKRETMEELGIELNIDKAIKIKRYRTGKAWLEEYIVAQEVDLNKIILQKEEVCDVKFATFEEIDKLFKDKKFIDGRWEYVREEIENFISKRKV